MKLTFYAQKVIEELNRLGLMLIGVIDDNEKFNKRLSDHFEQQKKSSIEYFLKHMPAMSEGDDVKERIHFEGDPPLENADYTSFLRHAIAEFALCRAIDCYHWYLKQIVLLSLEIDPSLIVQWSKELQIGSKRLEAFKNKDQRGELLTKLFRGHEKRARELVHKHWSVPLGEDIAVLVEARNCIVHQRGEVLDGGQQTVLEGSSRAKLKVLKNRIFVEYEEAHTALEIVTSDLSIIDQILARKLQLPTSDFVSPVIKRSY